MSYIMSRLSVSLALWAGIVFACAAEDRITASGAQSAKKPGEPKTTVTSPSPRVRWLAAENSTWRWYRRESLVKEQWELTGITTPVHKRTGERYTGATGYLDESAVPVAVKRRGRQDDAASTAEESSEPGRADAARRERGGRPPSKWLRSLTADELRAWLKTIEVPEATVEGATYFEHLTRDHSFDPEKIEGLTEEEQAKLHAAAHHGY
jgi:hypothetical protein